MCKGKDNSYRTRIFRAAQDYSLSMHEYTALVKWGEGGGEGRVM